MLKVQSGAERLEQFYIFRGWEKVLEFLERHPKLIKTLLGLPEQVNKYFSGSKLFLEVVADTEIPDWLQLVVWIVPNSEIKDEIQQLNQLHSQWVWDNLDPDDGNLVIWVE